MCNKSLAWSARAIQRRAPAIQKGARHLSETKYPYVVQKVVVDRRSIAYIGGHLEFSPDDLDDVVYLLQSREVVAYLFLVLYNPSPLRCDLHSGVHQPLASLSSHDGSSGSGESARRDGVCQGVDRHSGDFLEQPFEAYLSLSMLVLARSCIATPCTGLHMQRSSV